MLRDDFFYIYKSRVVRTPLLRVSMHKRTLMQQLHTSWSRSYKIIGNSRGSCFV